MNQVNIESSVIFIVIILLVLIVSFWYYFIEIPNQIREKENWLNENEDKLKLQGIVSNIIFTLKSHIPPCKKCGDNHFQIWNVDGLFEYRCMNCKRKDTFKIKNIDEVSFVFIEYGKFVKYVYGLENSKLSNHLKSTLIWDFLNIRKSNPLLSAIDFIAEGEIKIDDELKIIKNSRRISQEVKNQVWKRDEGKCVECGSNEKLEFDHIIPFSKGGANTYRNLQLLCELCNRKKSSKI